MLQNPRRVINFNNQAPRIYRSGYVASVEIPDNDGSAPTEQTQTDCSSREEPSNETPPPQCPVESVSPADKISTPAPIQPEPEVIEKIRKVLRVEEELHSEHPSPSDVQNQKLYRKVLNRLFPERHKAAGDVGSNHQ